MPLTVDLSGAFLISEHRIEPDEGVMGIGSGCGRRCAGGRAPLLAHTDLAPRGQCPGRAMAIAASLCVYTNNEIVIEEL